MLNNAEQTQQETRLPASLTLYFSLRGLGNDWPRGTSDQERAQLPSLLHSVIRFYTRHRRRQTVSAQTLRFPRSRHGETDYGSSPNAVRGCFVTTCLHRPPETHRASNQGFLHEHQSSHQRKIITTFTQHSGCLCRPPCRVTGRRWTRWQKSRRPMTSVVTRFMPGKSSRKRQNAAQLTRRHSSKRSKTPRANGRRTNPPMARTQDARRMDNPAIRRQSIVRRWTAANSPRPV